MKTSVIGALAAAAIAWNATSPAPQAFEARQAGSDPGSGAGARTVRIDVIASGRTGRPALDLSLKDFELRDEGVLQSLDSAELRRPPRSTRPSEVPPVPVLSAEGERTAARNPGTRLLALFLDEYHVGSADAERARDALDRFVSEQVRPGDLLVAMKPLDSLTSIRLTHDRDAVRDVIRSFVGRKDDFAPRTPFESDHMGRTPETAGPARRQVVLSALDALAAHLGGLREGRKALVVVSEGFAGGAASRGGRLPGIADIGRTANGFNVAIYALDPRADVATPAPPEQSSPQDDSFSSLRNLAEQTGGAAFAGERDTSTGLRQAADDLDAYYLLSYRPSGNRGGGLHTVQVLVRRPDVRVRTRAAYWMAPMEAPVVRTERPSSVFSTRLLHQSPLVRPWFGIARGTAGRTRVTFTWEPGASRAGDRRFVNPSSVLLSAMASDGSVLYRGRVAPLFADRAGPSRWPERAVFETAPGMIQLDMTIEGGDDQPLDSDARELDVADLNGAGLTMGTPEVFRTRTAREFLAACAAADAPPVVSRDFSPAERLLIRVPVYTPAGAATATTARLVRFGRSLRELSPMPESAPDGAVQFDVPLGGLSAGDYVLEIVAIAAAGRTEARVSFRVSG
jgi:VWFA-related protein